MAKLQKSGAGGDAHQFLPLANTPQPEYNLPVPEKLVQDEDSAENYLRIAGMAQSIKALHLLLSLQSMSSGCSTSSKLKISPSSSTDEKEKEKHSDKYERLIGAIRVMEDDIEAERCKLKRLNTYGVYADIARFSLFCVGFCALLTLFS